VTSQIEVVPVAGEIGAELRGVKLGSELSADVVAEIRRALLANKVIFFREQEHLTVDEHLGFSQLLGPVTLVATEKSRANGNEKVRKIEARTNNAPWHADGTFIDSPPAFSVLRAVNVPPAGGDTCWANTVTAYQSISKPLQDLYDQLWARHDNYDEFTARMGHMHFVAHHPVVQVHPETGEKAFLLGLHARNILGVSPEEAAHLHAMVQEAITRPDHTVRWRWRPGDVAIWDNRITQHSVIFDYGDFPRAMERVTVAGPVIVGVDGTPSQLLEGDRDWYQGDLQHQTAVAS
jgi:alpha-ketoglutarate-dependent sulfate ester dioxygenase